MSPRLLGIAILLLATQFGASASPKIAVIRVKDVYTDQPQTTATQEKARKAKEELLLDPRAEELRERLDALRQLQKKISDPQKRPSSDEGRKLAREFEIKRLEVNSLQQDFEKFRNDREKEIHTEMVAEMRKTLNLIVATAQRAGRDKGYDLVIDSSGYSNTSAPFVVYARNPPDLTEEVIDILRKERANPNSGSKTESPPGGSSSQP